MKTYQVVFHLDEDSEEKTNEVFNNIRNLLVDLGEENVDVELLVNGRGVLTMRKTNEPYPGHLYRSTTSPAWI